MARGNEELVFGAVAGTVVRAFADNADMKFRTRWAAAKFQHCRTSETEHKVRKSETPKV